MKYLSLLLLLALTGYAQIAAKLPSKSKWNADGSYYCPVNEFCSVPSQKEIEMHKPPNLTISSVIVASLDGIIIQCAASADGKVRDCVIAKGHTLDDAINAVLQTEKESADSQSFSLKEEAQRYKALYSLAVEENKEILKCANNLDQAASQLEKIEKAKP